MARYYCKFNEGVVCTENPTECYCCGFNPAVSARRYKQFLRDRYGIKADEQDDGNNLTADQEAK